MKATDKNEESGVLDLTPLLKKYKGQWVALKDDNKTVVASGDDLLVVKQVAEKKGFSNPIFFRVPSKATPFIG